MPMPYSRNSLRPAAHLCKGTCHQLSSRTRPIVGQSGGRYCTTCEKFFVKEVVDKFKKKLYCPCCRLKTRKRRISNPKEEPK